MNINKQMKTMITAAGMVLLTGLAGISGSAMASTPDGETPANEGVCDVLIGATPGLFGLCNAYCEAQDLDTFEKEPPNTKILANYNKKRKAGDPEMPCLQTPCPCISAEELASFTADGMVAACVGGGSSDKIQIIDNAPLTKFADADKTVNRERCRYIDLNAAPPLIRNMSITAAEAAACFSQIEATCP